MKIITNIIFLTFIFFAHFECAEGSGRFDLNIPLDIDGEPIRDGHKHASAKASGRSDSNLTIKGTDGGRIKAEPGNDCAEGSGRSDGNIALESTGERIRDEPEDVHSPVSNRSPSDTSFPRERSRSPSRWLPSSHGLEDVGYTRLVPEWNSHRVFEFRRYILPDDKRFRMKVGSNKYPCMPVQEYIVLSTIEGEVFATVENMEFLKGIYNAQGRRMKIQMRDGTFERMTFKEISDTPVGLRYKIKDAFSVIPANYDSLQLLYH